jgi:hypothetical protein
MVIGAPMGHKFVGFDWMLFVMVPFFWLECDMVLGREWIADGTDFWP